MFQVKGLSDGGVDGINRSSRDGGRPSSRAWSPPPQTLEAGIKRDRDLEPPLGPRPTSPKPSGRIAMPDSQLPSNSMPPPFFPSPYRFGLHRPESASMKPSSTSAIFSGPLSGPAHAARGKADLPSPGSRDPGSGYHSKFSPGREREREEYELSNRNKEFDLSKSPNGDVRDRSPHAGISRPSSSDQFDLKPRQMTSDSTTEKGNSPGGPRRFPDDDPDRNGGRRSQDHVKMERLASPGSDRNRTFSGDFTRETLSRLSTNSAGSRSDSIIGPAAAQGNVLIGIHSITRTFVFFSSKHCHMQNLNHFLDLRTTDHERVDIQNLARIDALKRIAETNAARFGVGAANNLSSIQNTLRDTFIAGAPGFNNIPLTAPLGIPASDLARIAVQVPDPAGNGEATSGTGIDAV